MDIGALLSSLGGDEEDDDLGFLKTLFGGKQEPTQSVANTGGFKIPGVSAPVNQMSEEARTPQQQEQDITVQGDSWKPKKVGWLGGVLDAVSEYTEDGTPFADKRRRENMSEAMRGMDKDPERAISRMRQLDPEAAWKMNAQYQDDRRADAAQSRLTRMYDDKNYENFRRYSAQALSGTNPNTFTVMLDRIRKQAQQRGIDPETLGLPSAYDPENIETLGRGEMPVARREALDQALDRQSNLQEYRGERLEQGDRFEAGRNTRAGIAEGGRNARFQQGQAGQNARQQNGIFAKDAAKMGLPPNAKPGQWVMGKKDPSMASRFNGEVWEVYQKRDGKMVRIR